QAEDGIRDFHVTGVQTCALPILAEVTTKIVPPSRQVDESLPVVVTGRAPWRTDVEARGVTVSLRAIPLKDHGIRIGAIVLCRDVDRKSVVEGKREVRVGGRRFIK